MFEEFNCCDNKDIILSLYNLYGADMVRYAKGAYALSIWDKKDEKVFITNDLLSKRSIYYRIDQNGVSFAGSFFDLVDLLSITNYIPKINVSAVQSMSAQGYLTGNTTYLEDVFYLNAFESIVIDLKTNTTEIIKHKLKSAQITEDVDALIDQFDSLFTNAVKLQFDKNKDYGYQQVSTLSGGMDSRACLLKGIDVGYKNDIICFNYAQSGSLDFQISQQIAIDYHLNYIFYPMDSALFVPTYKNSIARNECQQRAIGSTAAVTLADLLNTTNFGIIHTGLLGGELMGDLITFAGAEVKNKLKKVINILFAKKINSNALCSNFNSLLDQLRACQNFAYMFLERCEVFSPFLDEDVFEFLSQLEPKHLYQRKFYLKWTQKYIPNHYILTHLGCRADASPLKIVATKTYYTLQKKLTGKSTKEMNPFDFWFHNNPEYKQIFTKDFDKLCGDLNANENMSGVVKAAADCWSDNWLKNACVLTALNGVKTVCQKLSMKNS